MKAQEKASVIAKPEDAINVLEFEAAAQQALPPAHFGYLSTGVDADATLHANRDAFERIQLRPRRLRDITKIDMRTELFGTTWDTPVALAPIGNQKAFNAEGELPVARAARAKRSLQVLSTAANTSVEEIGRTLGRAPWFQLYPTSRFENTEKLVRRAEAAGCPVIALTIDTQAGRHTETLDRFKRLDSRPCASCHGTKREDFYRRKPMFEGLVVAGVTTNGPALTWADVRKLKKMTSMKFLIKGIEVAEDARLCLENGLDGIIVSNHGGRAEESGRATVDCLPEVVAAVGNKIPVMIDGGFRRGTDIFKALALGARAVFIGRPYVWASAAFGQAGVERVITMLNGELELVMKQCGTRSIAEVSRDFIRYRDATAPNHS
ncbi:MAG: alpha-hydroxy-acid oxidizing protein [Acidobacteriota bacterium]|nr:alpha-hydroxy-acid oxidizing protein [Acidobacteriota bacterium]